MSQPEEPFIAQVRDLLANLYDNSYLQAHRLAEQLAPASRFSPRERLRFLRTTILEAIEELNPGAGVPLRELRARSYNVISLHYVEGMTIGEVAAQLAVSERQAYRDLRKAEQEVASLLWVRWRPAPDAVAEPMRAELVREEAGRLGSRAEPVDVSVLLEGALAAVAPLGDKRGLRLAAQCDPGLIAHTDRSLARQALISILSSAAQNSQPDTVIGVLAKRADSGAQIEIHYIPSQVSGEQRPPVAAQQLIRCLGGSWSCAPGPGTGTAITLLLAQPTQVSVLVIDDNAGLLDLFRRYLADQPYQLLGARDGDEGLRLAAEHRPHIIVLDVMMPQMDGWEVLQLLHGGEQTRAIPVIVCSVLDDPQLALALGAAEYLAKPVSRAQLLQALARNR